MSKMKVFCFGFGQVAKYFVKKIIKENQAIELSVTSRKETQKLIFESLEINSYELNEKKIDKNMNSKIQDADFMLVSIPPINEEDIVIKNFKRCSWEPLDFIKEKLLCLKKGFITIYQKSLYMIYIYWELNVT